MKKPLTNYPLYLTKGLRKDLNRMAKADNRKLHNLLINILKEATDKYKKNQLDLTL